MLLADKVIVPIKLVLDDICGDESIVATILCKFAARTHIYHKAVPRRCPGAAYQKARCPDQFSQLATLEIQLISTGNNLRASKCFKLWHFTQLPCRNCFRTQQRISFQISRPLVVQIDPVELSGAQWYSVTHYSGCGMGFQNVEIWANTLKYVQLYLHMYIYIWNIWLFICWFYHLFIYFVYSFICRTVAFFCWGHSR